MDNRFGAALLMGLALAVAGTACSSDGGERLDRRGIETQLEGQAGLEPRQARCASAELADAGLTADDLSKLDDGTPGVSDAKVRAYVDAMMICVTVEPPTS